MAVLRATLFYTGIILAMLIYAPLSLLILPLPYHLRYRIVTQWTHIALWWLRITCGLGFSVSGRENIPPGPAIIMCKHQSAWETMAVQLIFSAPLVFIMKRELLWIPLFGWGLASLRPVAIDRGSGLRAARQIVDQGLKRLRQGSWVVVFPEGTRIPPGETGRYLPGGGMLAEQAGCPVVPMAHNAGCYWPKSSFTKRPGTIRVVIGPPIETRGRSSREITEAAADWIEPVSRQLQAEASTASPATT